MRDNSESAARDNAVASLSLSRTGWSGTECCVANESLLPDDAGPGSQGQVVEEDNDHNIALDSACSPSLPGWSQSLSDSSRHEGYSDETKQPNVQQNKINFYQDLQPQIVFPSLATCSRDTEISSACGVASYEKFEQPIVEQFHRKMTEGTSHQDAFSSLRNSMSNLMKSTSSLTAGIAQSTESIDSSKTKQRKRSSVHNWFKKHGLWKTCKTQNQTEEDLSSSPAPVMLDNNCNMHTKQEKRGMSFWKRGLSYVKSHKAPSAKANGSHRLPSGSGVSASSHAGPHPYNRQVSHNHTTAQAQAAADAYQREVRNLYDPLILAQTYFQRWRERTLFLQSLNAQQVMIANLQQAALVAEQQKAAARAALGVDQPFQPWQPPTERSAVEGMEFQSMPGVQNLDVDLPHASSLQQSAVPAVGLQHPFPSSMGSNPNQHYQTNFMGHMAIPGCSSTVHSHPFGMTTQAPQAILNPALTCAPSVSTGHVTFGTVPDPGITTEHLRSAFNSCTVGPTLAVTSPQPAAMFISPATTVSAPSKRSKRNAISAEPSSLKVTTDFLSKMLHFVPKSQK